MLSHQSFTPVTFTFDLVMNKLTKWDMLWYALYYVWECLLLLQNGLFLDFIVLESSIDLYLTKEQLTKNEIRAKIYIFNWMSWYIRQYICNLPYNFIFDKNYLFQSISSLIVSTWNCVCAYIWKKAWFDLAQSGFRTRRYWSIILDLMELKVSLL